jgi:peptide/nickel transport system ATP-binding protein
VRTGACVVTLTGHGIVAGYRRGIRVLDGVDLVVEPGAVVGLAGPSGCGKSTLTRVLALLQAPWGGAVEIDGVQARGARYRAPRELRTAVGVVFQNPRLATDPRLPLREIVAEPLLATGRGRDPRWEGELHQRVGLTPELLVRRPHEVSDGQLQRACLARALVLRPRYLICDEMTAMLDASTTAALVGVVAEQARGGTGVLAVSHDEELLTVWADHVERLFEAAGHPR